MFCFIFNFIINSIYIVVSISSLFLFYSIYYLYLIKEKGLAVIQQRYNPHNKTTWWSEIDMWLIDDLYLQPGFKTYFDAMSGSPTDGLYPTVTIRQIMWALRMKPLPKQRWETTFDRKFI